MSLGSFIALVIFLLASLGFGFYVANFGNYNKTYGAIGGVIVMLLWLWILNMSLLFGAEFDAEMERGRQLQAGIEAEETIQLPPRDTKTERQTAGQRRRGHPARGRELREHHDRERRTGRARNRSAGNGSTTSQATAGSGPKPLAPTGPVCSTGARSGGQCRAPREERLARLQQGTRTQHRGGGLRRVRAGAAGGPVGRRSTPPPLQPPLQRRPRLGVAGLHQEPRPGQRA